MTISPNRSRTSQQLTSFHFQFTRHQWCGAGLFWQDPVQNFHNLTFYNTLRQISYWNLFFSVLQLINQPATENLTIELNKLLLFLCKKFIKIVKQFEALPIPSSLTPWAAWTPGLQHISQPSGTQNKDIYF